MRTEGSVCIYALVDPRDGECRYVGKTKGSTNNRLRGHINDAKRRPREIPRFSWINKLDALGLQPRIVTLELVDAKDWQTAEKMWIREMKHRFPRLLNATAGGDGIHGLVHSAETRRKQSLSATARYMIPGERERSGEAVRKALANPESRERLKDAAKIRSADPRVRALISERMKNYMNDPQVRAARSAALKGRVISPEWRAKISASKKGLRPSDATRAKMSEARKGRKHSPETIEKMKAIACMTRSGLSSVSTG